MLSQKAKDPGLGNVASAWIWLGSEHTGISILETILGTWVMARGGGGKGAGSRGSTGNPVLSVGRDLPFPVLCSFLWDVFLVSTELLLLSPGLSLFTCRRQMAFQKVVLRLHGTT